MPDKLDAIIFGATGFTGKIVVEKAVEVLQGLTWGIAGRNLVKQNTSMKVSKLISILKGNIHFIEQIGERIEYGR